MTKEEIQKEYATKAGELGHQFYRLILPSLECLEKCWDMLRLNKEMSKLLTKEKEEAQAAQQTPLKVV